MNQTSCCHSVTISVTNTAGRDESLGQAVDHGIEKALMERRRGILVLQETYGRYAVSLSEDVPFRMTRELPSWRAR